MQLRAVVLAHGGGEAAARHRGGAAGGAPLGHLDDGDAGLGAFERGHGSGGAAADDQHVGLVSLDRELSSRIGLLCVVFWLRQVLAISTNASTQASAKALSLMCSGSSSIARGLQVRFEGIDENPVVVGMLPRPLVVAVEIVRAALGMLAEAFERDENAHRSLGRVEPFGEFRAQLPEFLGVGAHEQVLRVVLEEFARLVTVGHLADPEIGVVDRARHDHLRQAGGAGAGHARSRPRNRRRRRPDPRARASSHRRRRQARRSDASRSSDLPPTPEA